MTARIALVTGVVGGIGAAIAARLATEGAHVLVSDLPGDALVDAARRLGLPALAADLGHPESVTDMIAKADRGSRRARHPGQRRRRCVWTSRNALGRRQARGVAQDFCSEC